MSLTFGACSSSKNMGFDENKEEVSAAESGIVSATNAERFDNKEVEKLCRQISGTSRYTTEDEEDEEGKRDKDFILGPQFSLKEQLEKDKVCFYCVWRAY